MSTPIIPTKGLRIVAELQGLDARTARSGSRDNVARMVPLHPAGVLVEVLGLSGEQLAQLGPLYGQRVVLHIEAAAE